METLSEYSLIYIFRLLDNKSLLRASEVCKSWNEIIKNSSIAKKLRLMIGKKNMKELFTISHDESMRQQMKTLKRQYTSILLSQSVLNYNIGDFLIGQRNLCKLEIFDCDLTEDVFFLFLTNFPNLTEIKIKETSVIASVEKKIQDKVKMSSLQRLYLNQSACNYLGCIGETINLRYLHIDRTEYGDDLEDCLGDFLQRQKTLEELYIFYGEELIDIIHNDGPQKYQFRLKSLHIFFMDASEMADHNKIINFLQLHSSTLKHLSFHSYSYDYEISIDYIFRYMQLESLEIDHPLPKEAIFYENLQPNTYLKKLVVYKGIPNVRTATNFMGVFKNLKELIVHRTINETLLQQIIRGLPMLTHLELDRIKSRMEISGTHTLEYLRIKQLCVHSALNIPSLKTFVIDEYRYDKSSIINCHLPELEKLIIVVKPFTPTRMFLKELEKNCPKLQLLKIRKTTSSRRIIEKELRSLSFRVELKVCRNTTPVKELIHFNFF